MTRTGQQNGVCASVTNGTSCGNVASCAAPATFTPAGACDGAGNCVAGTARPCTSGLTCASTTACRTACSADAHCAGGYYCNLAASTCTAKKGTGLGCAGNSECTSNACVDNVCCGAACALAAAGAGACMGCAAATTGSPNGTCAMRSGATTRACPVTNPTACVNLQTDPNNCGVCGMSCPASPAPPATARACIVGDCGFACTASATQLCTVHNTLVRSCIGTSWSFDGSVQEGNGSVDGWLYSNETRIILSNGLDLRHSGPGAISLYASSLETYTASAYRSFCDGTGDGYIDARGKTVSAWVYVAGQPTVTDFCRLSAYGTSGPIAFGASATRTPPPQGTWFQLTGTFSANDMQVQEIRIECRLPTAWNGDDSRRWYIDDVTIN
jgi:hypothetical protein